MTMAFEDDMKGSEAEACVRFLAGTGQFRKESTPYRIAEELNKGGLKINSDRVKFLLALLSVKFPSILGYKQIGTYHLFWIHASETDFHAWFAEWYGHPLEST